MRIGLSYRSSDSDHGTYPAALERRGRALGVKIEAVWLAGAAQATRSELLDGVDAVLFTGGADVEPARYGASEGVDLCRCDPARDAAEWQMLEALQQRPLPVLAICRGAQLVNVFYGGTLMPDLGPRNPVHRAAEGRWGTHDVRIAAGTRLEALAGGRGGLVNTSHHQAVDRLAPGFRISARSEDGVIEAFEADRAHAQPFLLGVQWHPEAMEPGLPLADRLLDAFLRLFREKH
jgi:putative glutamine amidotransferase